ncbi:MAG: TrkA family potassium uptake protein [Candidatus Methanoperedens sp.]
MKRFILIGYGDVGISIAQVLEKAHVNFVVIDKNEAKLKGKGFDFVAGDAADEEILKRAGVQTASTVIIVLNNDADIIFTTLITRNLNPHSIILARANTTKSIDKIYRAGADYVASLSIVAGQMLAHIAIGREEENIMMLEGLEIARHHITSGSPLVGKTIADAKIRSSIGCTIIGIEENGNTTTDVDPSIIIRDGMTLAIIGNCEQISKFKEEYARA